MQRTITAITAAPPATAANESPKPAAVRARVSSMLSDFDLKNFQTE
jgi:hypothetical protein